MPTYTGTPTYTDINTNSVMQFDSPASVNYSSGGMVVLHKVISYSFDTATGNTVWASNNSVNNNNIAEKLNITLPPNSNCCILAKDDFGAGLNVRFSFEW